MNARTHIPLRDQIIAHLTAHGEATADEITRAIGLTNTPSKVTNELNAMRCDAIIESERKGKTGAHHYWLSVPAEHAAATPTSIVPRPTTSFDDYPPGIHPGTRKAQAWKALANGEKLSASDLCKKVGCAKGALDPALAELYRAGTLWRERPTPTSAYVYFRGSGTPQPQPAVGNNTGSDGSAPSTTPEAVAIPQEPQPEHVGPSLPAPAAGDASPALLDVMHYQMAELRYKLSAVDAELVEASEELVRVIGDDTSVDTSDLSLAELVGEVEHQISRLRLEIETLKNNYSIQVQEGEDLRQRLEAMQRTVPTDPAYPALPTYNAGPYQVRVESLLVARPQDQIYSELTTTVRIADEAAGEFVEVEQSGRTDLGKIAICRDEWLALATAINLMIAQCRSAG